MTENPVWLAIWDELEADFRRRRADARRARGGGGLTVVVELMPGSSDFEFVPMETESRPP